MTESLQVNNVILFPFIFHLSFKPWPQSLHLMLFVYFTQLIEHKLAWLISNQDPVAKNKRASKILQRQSLISNIRLVLHRYNERFTLSKEDKYLVSLTIIECSIGKVSLNAWSVLEVNQYGSINDSLFDRFVDHVVHFQGFIHKYVDEDIAVVYEAGVHHGRGEVVVGSCAIIKTNLLIDTIIINHSPLIK